MRFSSPVGITNACYSRTNQSERQAAANEPTKKMPLTASLDKVKNSSQHKLPQPEQSLPVAVSERGGDRVLYAGRRNQAVSLRMVVLTSAVGIMPIAKKKSDARGVVLRRVYYKDGMHPGILTLRSSWSRVGFCETGETISCIMYTAPARFLLVA